MQMLELMGTYIFFPPTLGLKTFVKQADSPAAFYGRSGNSEMSTDSERRSVLMSTLLSANEPHNHLNAQRHFWETYEPSVAWSLRTGLHALSKLNTPSLYLFVWH